MTFSNCRLLMFGNFKKVVKSTLLFLNKHLLNQSHCRRRTLRRKEFPLLYIFVGICKDKSKQWYFCNLLLWAWTSICSALWFSKEKINVTWFVCVGWSCWSDCIGSWDGTAFELKGGIWNKKPNTWEKSRETELQRVQLSIWSFLGLTFTGCWGMFWGGYPNGRTWEIKMKWLRHVCVFTDTWKGQMKIQKRKLLTSGEIGPFVIGGMFCITWNKNKNTKFSPVLYVFLCLQICIIYVCQSIE